MTTAAAEDAGPAPYLGSALIVMLCVLAPAYFVAETSEGGSYSAWPAALAVTLIAGMRYAIVVSGRRTRPFEMSFWLFTYVFLGLAPLVQLRTAVLPPTTPVVFHALYDAKAMTIVLVGVACVLIGSVIAARRGPVGAEAVADRQGRELSATRTNILTTVMMAVSGGYLGVVGIGALFSDRTTLNQVRLAALGNYTNVSIASATVSMGLAVAAIAQLQLRRQRKLEGRPASLIPALTTIVLLIVCVNPISSPRFVVGTVLLGLAAGAGLISTIRRFRVVGVAGVLALVMIFPLLDAYRGSDVAYIGSVGPVDTLSESDYDAYNQIVNTVHYTEVNGIADGRQALGVLLFWVPRSLWKDKPQDTGIELADFMGYNFKNLSAPLFAEFFINGGWLLLILAAIGTGVLVRRLDYAAKRQIDRQGIPTVALCLLPFYALIVLRGSLLQSMLYLAVIVGASAFVYDRQGRLKAATRPGSARPRPGATGSVRR